MKRFLALLLVMMLILTSFAACGSNDEGDATDSGVNNEQGVEDSGVDADGTEEGDTDADVEDDADKGDDDTDNSDSETADKKEENADDSKKNETSQTTSSKPAASGNSGSTSTSGNKTSQSSSSNSSSGNTSSSKPAENNKNEAKAPSGTPAEIIEKIYAKKSVELSLGTMEVDLSDGDALKMVTGLSSADKIEAAAYSESMMGAQAYSLVVVKVKNSKNTKAVAEEMAAGIDTRKWVCVEADDLRVAAVDDVVVLIMVDSQFADTVTAKEIINAFSSICGGLDVSL